MSFHIARQGAWESIETFLDELEPKSKVIWVTFNVDPPPLLLSKLTAKRLDVTLIARHPFYGNHFSQSAWRTLKGCEAIERVWGIKIDDYADGEETTYGPLHAKFVVARTPGGRFRGLSGSFNFATRSFHSSSEHVHCLSERQARQAWEEAEAMRGSTQACEVQESDCPTGETVSPTPSIKVFEDPPSKVGTRQDRDYHRRAPVQSYRPRELQLLAEALDETLSNWPVRGGNYQQEQFERLRARDRRIDILYLPVGVGKTFIAIRWLLWRVYQSDVSGHNPTPGLFLAPNRWIQQTVRDDLKFIDTRAKDLAATRGERVRPRCEDYVTLATPSKTDTKFPWSATVADEVHNWSPRNQSEYSSGYTHVLRHLLNTHNKPILGLSATPCRVDHGRYSVSTFVNSFLGAAFEPEDAKPSMQLGEAISRGLLTRPRFVKLVSQKVESSVKLILSYVDGRVIRFGDYSNTTLRHVWEEIAGTHEATGNLVSEIVRHVEHEKSRRVVVFVPPLGSATDRFVATLAGRIESRGGRCFDFRTRAEVSGQTARETFMEFTDSRPEPGRPSIVVTIDRLGEGVSVPDIDMLVMLRATLSPRVAVQALGRGLRLHENKKECVVLDAVQFHALVTRWDNSVDDSISIAEHPVSLRTLHTTAASIDRSQTSIPDNWLEISKMTVSEARGRRDHVAEALGMSEAELSQYIDANNGNLLVLNALDARAPAWLKAVKPARRSLAKLSASRVSSVRSNVRTHEELSILLDLDPSSIAEELKQHHGAMLLPNAFQRLPLDVTTKYVFWYITNRLRRSR